VDGEIVGAATPGRKTAAPTQPLRGLELRRAGRVKLDHYRYRRRAAVVGYRRHSGAEAAWPPINAHWLRGACAFGVHGCAAEPDRVAAALLAIKVSASRRVAVLFWRDRKLEPAPDPDHRAYWQ